MAKAFTQADWIACLRNGKRVYHLSELMKLSGLSESSIRRTLLRMVQRKMLLRLGKGWYANSFQRPGLEEIVGILYPPCYISTESALSMHGIVDQVPQLVTCVTTNKTKVFSTDLGEVSYSHIKADLFFGYDVVDRIPLAKAEKAVLDYVYLQKQNGLEPMLDEWNREVIDREKLVSMMEGYPKTVKALLKRVFVGERPKKENLKTVKPG